MGKSSFYINTISQAMQVLVMITWMVLAYASFCGVANAQSDCPMFPSSLRLGQNQLEILDRTKALLIANGFLLTPDGPVGDAAFSPVTDPYRIEIYQKANALLIAQQLYMSQKCENLQTLTNVQKQTLLSDLSKTIPLSERCLPVPICDTEQKYVTYDGSCNNLENPKWGQEYTPYGRILPAVYEDGIYNVRKSVTNAALPSSRLISNVLLDDPGHRNEPVLKQNFGTVVFGQYISHDMALRRIYQNDAGGRALRCCPKDYKNFVPDKLTYYGCMPIEVPSDDPELSQHDMSCMNFIRSRPTLRNDCKIGAAEHANTVSHVLDNSSIYGSSRAVTEGIRTMESGKLKMDDQFQILPKLEDCVGNLCYYTGDGRSTFFPTQAAVLSIFMRFHNKIADKLVALQLDWDDNTLFQESRRIGTAVLHNIVYNEWLPGIIGTANAIENGLSCGTQSTYCGTYNQSVDPSTLAEMAHSAYRVLHTMLPNTINLYNAEFEQILSGAISDMMNGAGLLETNYNDVLRGLIHDRVNYGTYSYQSRHKVIKGNSTIGLDLATFDIERGRDTGLSPYYVYLNLAVPGGHQVSDWNDLSIVFSISNIDKLKQVYESPLDVDLHLGLILEEKNFSYIGLVATYIWIEQFKRAKFGDRFFYAFPNGANPFTPEQILEINKQTWASVLCENSDIEEMLVNAFETESPSNGFSKCSEFPSLNLNLWRPSN